jgi:hypothetical protein
LGWWFRRGQPPLLPPCLQPFFSHPSPHPGRFSAHTPPPAHHVPLVLPTPATAGRPSSPRPPLFAALFAVIIFDWDDTLLSSSWLATNGLRLDEPEVVPPAAMKQLSQLEASVIVLLERALEFGHVTIITNAETGWVELSARKFMPGVLGVLQRVHVMSARSSFERLSPDNPGDWKVCNLPTAHLPARLPLRHHVVFCPVLVCRGRGCPQAGSAVWKGNVGREWCCVRCLFHDALFLLLVSFPWGAVPAPSPAQVCPHCTLLAASCTSSCCCPRVGG